MYTYDKTINFVLYCHKMYIYILDAMYTFHRKEKAL